VGLEPLIEDLSSKLSTYASRLLSAVAILLLGYILAKLVRALMHRVLRRAPPELQHFGARVVHVAVLIGAVLWALSALKVQPAALAAALGALSLAITLSLQDVAKNLVSGIYLLLTRPFNVGDRITVGTNVTGFVEYVGLRATTLRDEDGRQIIVPNTMVMASVVTRQPRQEPPS